MGWLWGWPKQRENVYYRLICIGLAAAECQLIVVAIDMVFAGAKPPTKTILDGARGGIGMDRGDSEARFSLHEWS
jgi:hypothetical protein